MNVFFSLVFTLFIVVATGSKITDFWDQHSNNTDLQRIRNGQNAARDQFPYMIMLYVYPSNEFCAATLISLTRALTAAHCIYQPGATNNHTTMVYGTLLLDKYPPDEPNQIIQNATGVLWHPGYSKTLFTVNNDIGILFANAVKPGDSIAVVALPPDANNAYTNEAVVMTGWGQTSLNSPLSQNLQYLTTTVLSNPICQLQAIGFAVQSSHLCTSGSGNKGACVGDSGGPIVATVGGIKVVVAIISVGTCSGSLPSINTRVTPYLDNFILPNMN